MTNTEKLRRHGIIIWIFQRLLLLHAHILFDHICQFKNLKNHARPTSLLKVNNKLQCTCRGAKKFMFFFFDTVLKFDLKFRGAMAPLAPPGYTYDNLDFSMLYRLIYLHCGKPFSRTSKLYTIKFSQTLVYLNLL